MSEYTEEKEIDVKKETEIESKETDAGGADAGWDDVTTSKNQNEKITFLGW